MHESSKSKNLFTTWYAVFITVILVAFIFIAAKSSRYTVIQAHKFEIVDTYGNVVITIDQNGYKSNLNTNPDFSNNSNASINGRIKYLFKRFGTSSGFISISTLSGKDIESINYFSSFNEKITINHQVEYFYNKSTTEVFFSNALGIGKAANFEMALDLAAYHYVNHIYETDKK